MCAVDPTMRFRSSLWTPVISASAMTSAMTPTPTPRIETAEISEMNACLRRAVRYRRAMNHSNDIGARSQERKQNDVANRGTVCQQHDEPINSDAFAAGRRQAVLERADIVL